MAYATTTSYAGRNGAAAEAGLFAQLGAALQRRRVYSRTVGELRQLSDRELSDLGISRLMIPSVAREAAYGK